MIADDVRSLVNRRDYVGGRSVVGQLCRDRGAVRQLEPELARFYRDGDESQRRYIVDGILEHLFEDEAVRRLFNQWRDDPVLGAAFNEADAWAEAIATKRDFLTRIATECAGEIRSRGIATSMTAPEIGIDSVALTLNDGTEEIQLILDCTHDLVSSRSGDAAAESALGRYAADSSHWTTDEYAPWQKVVMLR